MGWTLAEDALDRHVVRGLEERSRNPILLSLYQFLTPARGVANILRFRAPWYRDSRVVRAEGFFADAGEGYSVSTAEAMRGAGRKLGAVANLGRSSGGEGLEHFQAYREVSSFREDGFFLMKNPVSGAASLYTLPENALEGDAGVEPRTRLNPRWAGPGGKHEVGLAWGLSLMSGHVFGYAGGVKYMPIVVRYSYEFARHRELWRLRYSPEVTALAMMDWPTPKGKTVFTKRERVYGSGVSPVSLQMEFRPLSRMQPFVGMNGGFVYFADRVLNAHGSQFMYTIGPAVGVNLFRLKRQAVTIGYRYDHLSNANISLHNPGTDANVFYLGISRFRTR